MCGGTIPLVVLAKGKRIIREHVKRSFNQANLLSWIECALFTFFATYSREVAHWPLQSQSCATAQWCCVGGRKWPSNEMSPALVWPLGAGLVDTGVRYWILRLLRFRCTHSVQPDGRYGSSTDTHFAWVSENLTC